ncbi:hypothetical protein K2173_014110 [Erythroxylum novogranatense]|uniref:cysteine dioxygenase n=1 Tax=Erythroxylum novogranatense TaxID=1862640 RepID=A0AAV8SE01_9ROSI|nr:hypothetical protein K2173_014110 [Erythroxylum novogranatense]
MGIETSAGNIKREKGNSELAKNKNQVQDPSSNTRVNTSNRGKKTRRRLPKKGLVVSPVQTLYDTCKDVFTFGGIGVIPSPESIEKLRTVLDGIKAADFDVSPDMPFFRNSSTRRTQAIGYLHIYECDKFSIGIFCLPPSGVIPLHNHPGMTVFSKLLFGTMHIKSYDWVVEKPSDAVKHPEIQESEVQQPEVQELEVKQSEVEQSEPKKTKVQQPGVRLAKVKVDSDFTAPCNTSILYPADGGNMHCFTALTACAVLDVLGPPYNDSEGRHCTYYLDFPYANFSVDGLSVPVEERDSHAWLQEREKPEDLAFIGELYKGPKILE